MHNKTISWNDNWILIFICFVGRLLLEPSSSSFIITSFLIQMLIWIIVSSRVESFVLILIAWGIFFGLWELYLQLLPFSLLLFESSFFLCALFLESIEGNHFLLAHIPRMNKSHDLGRPFKVLITISHYLLLHSLLQVVLWFERPLYNMTVWSLHSGSLHSSTSFSKSSSNLGSSLQIAWSRNQTFL